MRRSLSIILIMVFGLGPLAAAMDGNEEVRLPACCRRHGVHHCALGALQSNAGTQSAPALAVPTTCPDYPGLAAMFTAPVSALAAQSARVPLAATGVRMAAGGCEAIFSATLGAYAGRGPPKANLS
jgi:hypothetical protein